MHLDFIVDGGFVPQHLGRVTRCRRGRAARVVARSALALLCEATLPPDRTTPISMNAAQATEIATKAGVDRLVLTHLLPDTDASDAFDTASQLFDGQVIMAEPGLTISVG